MEQKTGEMSINKEKLILLSINKEEKWNDDFVVQKLPHLGHWKREPKRERRGLGVDIGHFI